MQINRNIYSGVPEYSDEDLEQRIKLTKNKIRRFVSTEPIQCNRCGKLIDGAHRLAASIFLNQKIDVKYEKKSCDFHPPSSTYLYSTHYTQHNLM